MSTESYRAVESPVPLLPDSEVVPLLRDSFPDEDTCADESGVEVFTRRRGVHEEARCSRGGEVACVPQQ
jgi:hypothetical protein